MAYIRKLPSGLWQATVRHPSGKRHTRTDPLKRVVAEWARDLEAQYARGDLRDPRAGRIVVGEWYRRWINARGVEPNTRDKLESIWRTHCHPAWATWPMDSITVMEAQQWVNALQRTRVARHRGRNTADGDDAPLLSAGTVLAAVHLMVGLYGTAMRERPPIVLSNPFHGLDLPRLGRPAPAFFSHDEADAILEALTIGHPDQPQWRLAVEVGMWMGLRPGEIFGLAGDRVDWLRGLVHVQRVKTRHGIREYPKTDMSHRTVPMHRADLGDDLSRLLQDRPRNALLFTYPSGGEVDDSWFRKTVWYPAIEAAGTQRLSPRGMRHTAASWLVMDGVDLYRVQALLGHRSHATTQRYAHLAPEAHDKIRESWRRMGDARRLRAKRDSGSA